MDVKCNVLRRCCAAGGGLGVGSVERMQKELAQKLFVFMLYHQHHQQLIAPAAKLRGPAACPWSPDQATKH